MENKSFFKKLTFTIKNILYKNKIEGSVSYRLKTPASALRKLAIKEIEIKNISDLMGYRIVVASELDCYKILNLIQNEYPVVTIQDWIKIPKNNSYQSIHLNIFSSNLDRFFELQIRSSDMHNNAENGYASHTNYKNEQSIITEQFIKAVTKIDDMLKANYLHINFDLSEEQFTLYENFLEIIHLQNKKLFSQN